MAGLANLTLALPATSPGSLVLVLPHLVILMVLHCRWASLLAGFAHNIICASWPPIGSPPSRGADQAVWLPAGASPWVAAQDGGEFSASQLHHSEPPSPGPKI